MTDFRFVPGFIEAYGDDVQAAEDAAGRIAEHAEQERARLLRADGTPKYMPEEHQEQERAIRDAAVSAFEAETARSVSRAEREVADCERALALLDRDPLDALSADEQAKASARMAFIREDVERLPADELARRAHAAVVAGDKALMTLYVRYLPRRGDHLGPALRSAVGDLEAALGLDTRQGRRREIEQRLRAAKTLPVALDGARRAVDGSHERMVAEMRRQYGVRG